MALKKLSDALSDAFANIAGAPSLDQSGGARAIFDVAWQEMETRLFSNGATETAHFRRRAKQSLERGMRVCESPIERAILPVLICCDYGSVMDAPLLVHLPGAELFPQENLVLVPQLALAKYRLDFALVLRVNGGIKITAVECDGVRYHKDNHIIRDGYLASWGVKTFHFEGKAILDSPFHITALISDHIKFSASANG